MNINQFLQMALIVGIGGFIGAILRFGVHTVVPTDKFPWSTLAINLIGSFVLGCIFFAYALNGQLTEQWRAFLCVGILGAFTTMSTFSLDTMTLFQDHETTKAMGNILLNVGGSIAAVWLASVLVQVVGEAA
jgi:CrcB protein